MTDHPILFTGAMVNAILREIRNPGTGKRQTRRGMKISGHKVFSEFGPSDTAGYDWHFRDDAMRWHDYRNDKLLSCLPYAVGDRLWVRENHYLTDDGENEYAVYAADQEDVDEHLANMQTTMASHPDIDWSRHLRLRSSIHMPRWASRITLDVTEVRVQRLQDISEADAVAEGAEGYAYEVARGEGYGTGWCCSHGQDLSHRPDEEMFDTAKESFQDLWNQINGPDAWDQNPWVVAYTFAPHLKNKEGE